MLEREPSGESEVAKKKIKMGLNWEGGREDSQAIKKKKPAVFKSIICKTLKNKIE